MSADTLRLDALDTGSNTLRLGSGSAVGSLSGEFSLPAFTAAGDLDARNLASGEFSFPPFSASGLVTVPSPDTLLLSREDHGGNTLFVGAHEEVTLQGAFSLPAFTVSGRAQAPDTLLLNRDDEGRNTLYLGTHEEGAPGVAWGEFSLPPFSVSGGLGGHAYGAFTLPTFTAEGDASLDENLLDHVFVRAVAYRDGAAVPIGQAPAYIDDTRGVRSAPNAYPEPAEPVLQLRASFYDDTSPRRGAAVAYRDGAAIPSSRVASFYDDTLDRRGSGVAYRDGAVAPGSLVASFYDDTLDRRGSGVAYRDGAVTAILYRRSGVGLAEGRSRMLYAYRDGAISPLPPGKHWYPPPPGSSPDAESLSNTLRLTCLDVGSNTLYLGRRPCTRPPRTTTGGTLMSENTLVARIVDSGALLPVTGFRASLGWNAWAWRYDITLATRDAILALISNPEIEVVLQGRRHRFVAEPSQTDARSGTVAGRSLTVLLSEPYAPQASGMEDNSRLDVQACQSALEFTGFALTWEPPVNHLIPARALSWARATPMTRVGDITSQYGYLVVPSTDERALTVRPVWPHAAWKIQTDATPDVTLDLGDCISYTRSWPARAYTPNRIRVASTTTGEVLVATITGTLGDVEAGDITSGLLAGAQALAARAVHELSETWPADTYALVLPLGQAGDFAFVPPVTPGMVIELTDLGKKGVVRQVDLGRSGGPPAPWTQTVTLRVPG